YTRTLLGESTDYEPFRISFEKLIKEYDQRQSQAFEDIARLEAGIDGLPLTQQQLQASLDQAANEGSLLALESEEDSFFPMRSLQKTLIPAGQAALDEAAAVGQQDPVEAFESLIPEASRLVTEAGAMTTTIQSFREIDLPEIERARSRLADHERLVGWIETALSDMSARCENLGSQGASVSIEEPWLAFDHELTLLKGRTLNSKQLTQRIHEELTPMVEQRSREIIEARSALARQLGIDEKSLLNEPNLRPDESLDDARNNITSALTAIDHGQATAARESLAEAERSLDDIVALISLSQTSAKDHATRLRELTEGHKTVSGEVAPAETLINEMREQYAPSVTLFASRFGEGIDGQKSIAESIERANRRLDQTRLELSESATAFNAGELIRGFGLLETVANELDFARHQLALIRDQHAALKQTEKNNGELAVKLGDRHRELALLSEDRRTCQSTIDAHLSTGSALEEWRVALQAPRPDPFQLHRTGESLEHQLNAVEDGIDADWKAFKMAESASTGAKAALTFCHTFLREAREDNIPDSRALSRAIVRHEELTNDHAGIEQQLEIAHSDWSELFAQTAHITAETGKVRSTLQSELAAGREAAQQIERAAAQITKLNRWRSSYYVKPNRHAGGAALVRAKQALFKGDYARARKAAVASRGEAERELARAKLNESRKASAAAAARRRAAQNSFSSGASFSSGSSFSSGFSSSSFSSGSGFSRSGW
ncbi:MAG: hypothetical protein HRU46_10425, partial [Verrucomicrobiales bacterium]|nr:hypothetical protein [Verrucomicrobiales bacterium]